MFVVVFQKYRVQGCLQNKYLEKSVHYVGSCICLGLGQLQTFIRVTGLNGWLKISDL